MIQHYSSRLILLEISFLLERLNNTRDYDRNARFFSSSLLELAGEGLDSVSGKIRVVCNSDWHSLGVLTAKEAKSAVWRSWTGSYPGVLHDGALAQGCESVWAVRQGSKE